ncbi:MAG: hypothetical protein U0414_10905 [Polyangiaceae bacterium]
MALALPKEAFFALAALGWVDGSMRKDEKVGLSRAAKECGISGDDLAAVESALSRETRLDEFVPGDMTEWQRVLTYSIGVWLTRLDGIQSTEEHKLLADLAKRLDLQKAICDRAAAAALDIAALPTGRPDTFEFDKLAARLAEKLPQVAKG